MSGGLSVKPRMYVNIPQERLGAVIGEEGSVKREISRRLGVVITIDTVNSIAVIEPENESIPPINVIKAAEILKAIAYGFTPDKAMSLLYEDYVLVVVNLKELVGDKENHLKRVKGRIIGEGGRARKTLEELTGVHIVVGDYHVAIIGEYERAMAAKEAVEMLARGRMHSTVYKHLDVIMRDIKRRERLKFLRGV